MTTVKYGVPFILYQYNSGAGDNGDRRFIKEFLEVSDAIEFKAKLDKWLSMGLTKDDNQYYDDFINSYIYYGYLKEVESIKKITTTVEEIDDLHESTN